MDDLSGLLVEGFGLRPRDRSAPMAASKARASARSSAPAPMPPPPSNPRTSWSTSPPGGLGGLDGIFGGTSGPRRSSPPAAVLDDDLFGVGRAPKTVDDDIFGSFSSASDDLLGGFGGKSRGGDLFVDFGGIGMGPDVKLHGDDLLGGFGRGSDAKGRELDGDQYAAAASDDLLGGFGGIGTGSDAKGRRSDGGKHATGADEDLLGGISVSGRGLDANGKKFDVDAYATNASDDLLGGFGGIEFSSDAKGRKSDGGNYGTRAGEDLLGVFATSRRGSGVKGNEFDGDGYPTAASKDLLGGFGGIGRRSDAKGKKLDGDSYATAASEDLLGGFGGIGRGSNVNEKKLDGDSYATVASEDLLGGFGRIGRGSDVKEKKLDRDSYATAASEDLLGGFGEIGGEANLKGENLGGDLAGNGAGGLDELLPGFGGASPPRVRPKFENNKSSVFEKSTTSIPKDPFINLDSTVPAAHSPGSFINTFEEFDIFSDNMKSEKTSRSAFDAGSFFDEFQGSIPLSTSDIKTNSKPYKAEGSTSTNRPTDLDGLNGSSDIDFMFAETLKKHYPLDDLVTKPLRPADEIGVHAQPMKSDQHERNSVKHVESADNIWFSVSESTVSSQSSASSSNIRKAASSPNILDDWNSLFAAPTSGDFQEIEGEPEERRKARLERHRRTLQRAAKALTEKNERDIQTERENAERHRIAETLDADIKRWAAGKEGNLRALLSSLQLVLWPECGWQPVTLTDLITSTSVKKVYRKATLCIHPDKVQQKGANVQQKYTAEKVFDILKEAWKKFNTEELS